MTREEITDGADAIRSGSAEVVLEVKVNAFDAMRRDETLWTRLRHYWCAFGPGDYPEEREEVLAAEDGEVLGKRYVCTRCGQPVHFITGPIEIERSEAA